MRACSSCGCYGRLTEITCPHCGEGYVDGASGRAAAALLLGLSLGMNGCVGQSKYGVPDSGVQAEYGVIDTGYVDDDEDGWTVRDGDCADDDPAIHPEATETADDGIDSNCDGNDNT